MRFNRSRDDIISDILEVASGGGGIATKMGIMYKTFLSLHTNEKLSDISNST